MDNLETFSGPETNFFRTGVLVLVLERSGLERFNFIPSLLAVILASKTAVLR